MALYKLEVLVPHYREVFFNGKDIKGIEVYIGQTSKKIGSVDTLLLDETKSIRYLVVDIGLWFLGKKILLPTAKRKVSTDTKKLEDAATKAQKQAQKDIKKVQTSAEELGETIQENAEAATEDL